MKERIIERADEVLIVDEYVHNVNSEGDYNRKLVIPCDWYTELGRKKKEGTVVYYYLISKKNNLYVIEVIEHSTWQPNITDWCESRRLKRVFKLPEEVKSIIAIK